MIVSLIILPESYKMIHPTKLNALCIWDNKDEYMFPIEDIASSW